MTIAAWSRRFATLLLGVLWVAQAFAQAMTLEILSLRNRSADDLLPTIRQLLVPGGTATGMNEKIFLRTTAENADEIRRLLATIDRPARRLMVQVTQQREVALTQRGAEISGDVGLGRNARIVSPPTLAGGSSIEIRRGGSNVSTRIIDSRSTASGNGTQSVQVIEGGRALINVGTSIPVPLRQVVVGPQGAVFTDTVVYRDLGSGFYVQPQLNGDRVTLEISQQADSPGGYGPGSANVQRLATTVNGRLGEWIELGGINQVSGGDGRTNLGVSTRDARDRRGIWLRVEELP